MRNANRRWAWFQGISLVAALSAIATLLLLQAASPLDRDTLAIVTGQLRSDAREARELARLNAVHAAYPTFTQQHARELREHVEDLASTLRGQRAITILEPVRRDAEDVASDVERALAAIAAEPASAIAQVAELDRLSERADSVHRRAKPGG